MICNSHCKRDQFPVSPEDGSILLIDPSAEDPLDHLTLSLTTGRLVSACRRGTATIEVPDLNREQLVEGRRSAVDRMGLFLGMWLRYANDGQEEATARVCGVIREQPFACVVQSMIRVSDEPGGDLVLAEPELVRVLRDPVFRDQLMAS